VALSFLYRFVYRVLETILIHRMDEVAKDAEILWVPRTPSRPLSWCDAPQFPTQSGRFQQPHHVRPGHEDG
jgi:hypothetical protein